MTEEEFLGIYQGILNRNKTPVVEIDATHGQVFVPREFIDEDGAIVLSLGPNAVRALKVLNDTVYCRASFKSQVFSLSFPLANVVDMFPEEGD